MTFPFPIFSAASRVSAGDIFTAMAANAGSFVSKSPSDYVGGMRTFGDTYTFTNSPFGESYDVFRNGDTSDSTFTAGAQADSLGLPVTSALAWQSTLDASGLPGDAKINGSAATEVAASTYDTSAVSDNSKTYDMSYRLFKATVALTASTTTASVDFKARRGFTQINNKGGFIFLPGEWEVASTGSALSGSGTLTIPAGQGVLLIAAGNQWANNDNLGLGTNSDVGFLLNFSTSTYDNAQIAFLGNLTGVSQGVSYSINADSISSPKPVFFKLAGT